MSEHDSTLEELLRKRARQSPPGGRAVPTPGATCGDPELLAAYAEGNLPAAERERFEGHLAGCAACQETVVRLVRLAPQESAAGRGVPAMAPVASPGIRWRWALPALASVVLVASVIYFERGRIPEPQSTSAPVLPIAEPPATPAEKQNAPAAAASAPMASAKAAPDANAARDGKAASDAKAAPEAKPESRMQATLKREEQANSLAKEKDAAPAFSPVPPPALAGQQAMADQAIPARTAPPPPAPMQAMAIQQTQQAPAVQSAGVQSGGAAQQHARMSRPLADAPEITVQESTVQAPAFKTARRDAANASAETGFFAKGKKVVSLTSFRKVISVGTRSFALNRMGQLFQQAVLGTWRGVQVPMGRAVADFTIVNQHLWTLLSDGKVVHSRDLGDSWDPPVDTGAEDATSIVFTSPTSGEIATLSGAHLYTSDGGHTWKPAD